MTAYCALDDALALLPFVGTLRDGTESVAASVPSLTQANALLAAVCAEIDMHLRGRSYVLPVADADALAALQVIAMNGAAAKLGKIKWPSKDGAGGDSGAVAPLRADYLDGLKFIDSGGLSIDATADESTRFNSGFADRAARLDYEAETSPGYDPSREPF